MLAPLKAQMDISKYLDKKLVDKQDKLMTKTLHVSSQMLLLHT